jgi:hypothetical protein
MIKTAQLWFILVAVITCTQLLGSEQGYMQCGETPWIRRIAPVGGWHPDEGGLLRWWNPCCCSSQCYPDDYCRKSLPNVCRLRPRVCQIQSR